MCDHPIVSIASMEAKGAAAAARGDDSDSHGMNWHAEALKAWQKGYFGHQEPASPALHAAPTGRGGFDAQQGVTARKLEVHQQRAAGLRAGMLMLELGAGMPSGVELVAPAVTGGAA